MVTRISLFTALVGITIAGAAPAAAQSDWRPFKALKLYVSDDADAGAQVFTTKGYFLVAPSGANEIFLLSPKDYTVHAVDRAALDGGAPTVDPETRDDLELVGVLQKQGATLKWEADDARFALSAKPPLLGVVSLEDLRAHTDKYEAAIAEYTPDPAAIETLRGVSEPTEVVVAFGIWCPVCAEWLPRFVKTLEVAGNENLSMTLVSINEDLDRPADLLESYGLDGVPAFVVMQGGDEIGRITPEWLEEAPNPVMERKLVEIIGAG